MKDFNKWLDWLSFLFVSLIILFGSVFYSIYLYNRDKQTDNYINSSQFQFDQENYANSVKSEVK
jgi:hypothetical protein